MFDSNFLKKKISIILVFICYFIIGALVYDDYGINWDEQASRNYGFINGNYILERILPLEIYNNVYKKITKNKFEEKIQEKQPPKLNDKNFIERAYGVSFELPSAVLETILNINEKDDVYKFRHILVFLVFFISLIFFYKICFLITKKEITSILFTSLIFLHPRIFSDAFYNSKDLIFLSYTIISIYFGLMMINKNSFKNILLFSFTTGLAISLKIIGIFILYSILMIFVFSKNYEIKTKVTNIALFSFLTTIFSYIFWPYLWENPIQNFISAIELFSNYSWMSEIPFAGKEVKSNNLPWNYIPTFFIITTPIFISFIILIGLYLFIFQLINFKKKKNYNVLVQNFFLSQIFLIPLIFSIINKSTLYDGWRHFFFMYPILLIIALNSLNNSIIFNIKRYKNLFVIFLVFGSIFQIFWNYKNHPFQNSYFNTVFFKNPNELFESDYWGISNKYLIDRLVNYQNSGKIYYKYETSNFKLSLDILNKKTKNRFVEYDGSQELDYYYLFILKRFRNFDTSIFEELNKNNEIVSEVIINNTVINGLYKININ